MSTDLSVLAEPAHVPNSLRIMLDGSLFAAATGAAKMLARAEGFVPRHLLGKTEACFAVVLQAHDWRLSPLAVARCTYQTPNGQVGYEGKLIHAIIESSGALVGGVSYEHFGDWSKVQGKFDIRKSQAGKDYAVPTWNRKDAEGLGVIVRATVKGEVAPREFRFELAQAFPLNSTLWATDPKTQICYTAARRFASIAVPHLVMGVPFDRDDQPAIGPDRARDITPAAERRAAMEAVEAIDYTTMDGALAQCMPGEVDMRLREEAISAPNIDALDEWVETNAGLLSMHPTAAEAVDEMRRRLGGEGEPAPEPDQDPVDQPDLLDEPAETPANIPAAATKLRRDIQAALDAGDHDGAVRLRMRATAWLPPKIAEDLTALMERHNGRQ